MYTRKVRLAATATSTEPRGVPDPAPLPLGDLRVVASPAEPAGSPAEASPAVNLTTLSRRIISNATIGFEVPDVDHALEEARSISEGVGGFVERLVSSGASVRVQAAVTFRVPQAQFSAVVGQLEKVGRLTSRSLGSDDVTEQFIELHARLKSSQSTEQNRLKLEEKAMTTADALIIQRERGRLNSIQRRVDLASVTVALNRTAAVQGQPPSGNLSIAAPNVAATAGRIKDLVATLKGVVDLSTVSRVDGHGKASLTVRVFAADFSTVVTSLEGLGNVTSWEINEGSADASAQKADKPDARIAIVLAEPTPQPSPNPNWASARSAGLPALLVLIAIGGLAFAWWAR